jgi:uncharacterized membrane protein
MVREVVAPAPKWAIWSTFVLSLLGLADATYLTIAHFTTSAILACADSRSVIDCAAVTTSAQSYLFHIPVAVLGLIAFGILAPLNSPWGWRITNYWVNLFRYVLVIGGLGMVVWLVYAELVIINHICLYCTGIHILVLSLFLILSNVTPKQLGWVATKEPLE